MGVEDEAEQSTERPCCNERQVQAIGRTHLIHRPARDIIPPQVRQCWACSRATVRRRGQFHFRTRVALTEAAATSLLLIGGGFFLTHLLRRRSKKQTILRVGDPQMTTPFVAPVVRAPPMAPKLSNTPRLTADDVTQSLRELRRTLRRAETSNQRRSGEYAFSNRPRESDS
jgi:hypothetical protein